MKDKIQVMLDEEIERKLQFIKECKPGSDEEADAIEKLAQLHKLRSEEAKNEQAESERYDDIDLKQAQLKSQAKDRWVNFGLQALVLVGGWIFSSYWLRTGYVFEETGTVRSPITRNLMNRAIPKK